MEVTTLIITNILAPIITGVVTWLLARRKYNSEVDQNLISNMKESLDFYKQLSDDNRERLSEVLKKNEELEREISELKSQMLSLTMNICMDLACKNRVANKDKNKKSIKKNNYETNTKEDSKA